jgi:hypothetical protein
MRMIREKLVLIDILQIEFDRIISLLKIRISKYASQNALKRDREQLSEKK